jgi:hypothetical protein
VVAGHVLRNGRLTHVDPQFQEFAVNSWRAPQRVGFRHRANQLADVPRNARSTHVASALPRPEEPEAATVPGEDRLGLDDHDGRPPSVPDPRHPDPQQSVSTGEPHPLRAGSLQDLELMTQCQDLKLQGRPSTE